MTAIPTRVWWVDDQMWYNAPLVERLQFKGVDVRTFDHPEDLLAEVIAPNHVLPDVIITDHNMPVMNGDTLVQKVIEVLGLSNEQLPRFIALSAGFGSKANYPSGCYMVSKPVKGDELFDLIVVSSNPSTRKGDTDDS